jgi:hypothetical protein
MDAGLDFLQCIAVAWLGSEKSKYPVQISSRRAFHHVGMGTSSRPFNRMQKLRSCVSRYKLLHLSILSVVKGSRPRTTVEGLCAGKRGTAKFTLPLVHRNTS